MLRFQSHAANLRRLANCNDTRKGHHLSLSGPSVASCEVEDGEKLADTVQDANLDIWEDLAMALVYCAPASKGNKLCQAIVFRSLEQVRSKIAAALANQHQAAAAPVTHVISASSTRVTGADGQSN